MAGIITSVEEDIKKLQELKQAIADVKNELKGINIKVDIDIKDNLEKQLQGLMTQYNDVATRVSEVQGKMMLLKNDVQKAMEAQSPAGDISKLINDGLRNMEQSSQSASQSVENLNDALDHNKQEIESNTQALNENATATEKVRLSNAQLVSEISEIANTDYENFVTRATNGTQNYTNAINQANSDIARLVSIQGTLNERFQAEEIGVEEYKNAMDEVQAAIQRTEAAYDSLRDTRNSSKGGNVEIDGLDNMDKNIRELLLGLAELEVANAKTKQSLKDLNKEFKDGNITEEDYIRKKAVIQNSLDEEAKAIQETRTQLKLQRQAVNEVEGSYNQLSAQYSLNKIILNGMKDTVLQNTEEYKKLNEETNAIYERMKQYQASTGKHQLNVGNYPSFSDSFKDIGNIEGLKEKFEEASIAIGEMQTSISNLSQTSSEYVAKGQELRNEISTLTSSFNEAVQNGMPVEEQSQAIDTIKSKIQEYGSVMMQSSAAAQTAYELQQDSIKALESELTNLQTALQAALAAGNTESADALAQEISNVNAELARAKEELNNLNIAAQNAKVAFESVVDEQAKMTQEIGRGGSFFGYIIDKTEEMKEKLKDFMKPATDAISSFTDTVRGKMDAVGQSISNTFSNLSQKIGFDRLGEAFNNVGNSILEYTSKITNAATGNGKFQQSLSSFKDGLNQLPIPLGKSVDGIVAMTRAMWAMVATPIGAVLTAIVLSLQALFQWFTKDAEGQRVFAKASAYLGSLLSSMTDIIITIGKYLYHAFADAGAPLNSFTKSLKTTFVSAVKTVSELVGGLGKALRGIFDKDWNTFYDGVSQMGKGLLDAGKTMVSAVDTAIKGVTGSVKLVGKALTDDNLAKDIGKHWDDAIPKAKESAALAERETNARIEAQKAQEKAAKLDAEIAKKREEIYTLTGKAKDAAIEETKALMKAKYDDQIKVQKEQLDILKTKNSLHTSSLEDLAKERDLNIQLLRTQARREASTRMMTRMQQSNLNKMKTSEKGATSKSNTLTAADTKWEETLRKNANERVKVEMDIEDQITEARIKAMEDGAEKIHAERERQNEKELEQIKKQRDAAIEAERNRQKAEFDAEQAVIKAAGGKTEKWDESKVDETFINKIKEQYEEIYNNIRKAQEKDLMTAELTAMRDYLKEYGTYQQQKLAITEEYAEKIGKTTDNWEKAGLEREKDSALKDLAAKEQERLKESIDWNGLFGDLQSYSVKYLQSVRKQLEGLLKDGSLPVEDMKTISERMHDIDDAISRQGGMLDYVGTRRREHLRLIKETAEAQERLNRATEKEQAAAGKHDSVVSDIQAVLRENNVYTDDSDITTGNFDNLMGQLDETNGSFSTMKGLLVMLAASEKDLADAREKVAKATNDAEQAEDKKARSGRTANAIAGWFSDAQDYIKDKGIDMIPDLLDSIGLGDTGIAKFASKGLEAFNSATGAAADFAAGNYIGALTKGIGAVSSLVGGIGGLFGSKDNHEEMVKIEQEMSDRIANLNNTMDNLINEMKNSGGAKAIGKATEAMEAWAKNQEYYRQGTLAVLQDKYGGKHREIYHWDKNIGGLAQAIASYYNLGSVESWTDVFSRITYEQLADIRQNHTDDWWYQMTTHGYNGGDMAEWLEKWADSEDTYNEIVDGLAEALTQVSFDSLRSSFIDSLMDMDKSASDFADDFQEYLMRAVLNAKISDLLDNDMEAFYKRWADYSVSGDRLEDWEIQQLRDEWQALSERGLALRDEAAAITGYTGGTSPSAQSTTVNTTMSLTEDTGKAMEGRMTAIHIAAEQGNVLRQQQIGQTSILNAKFDELLALKRPDTEFADNLLDMMANSYLELREINENTGSSAKSLNVMQIDLSDIKRELKNRL